MFYNINVLTQYNGAIVGPIAKILAYIINTIYSFFAMIGIENVAISIVLFTFIMRAMMMPIYYKQQKSGKLTSRMSPELTAITNKYKGKKDPKSQREMQLETQAVYEKYGSNPLSGCLPLLITFPIMIALYRVVQSLPAYMPVIKGLYENVANAIMGQSNYIEILSGVVGKNVEIAAGSDSTATLNSIIDVLATLNQTSWEKLASSFPAVSSTIVEQSTKIESIYNVFGLFSIADIPSFSRPITLIVPALAGIIQFINGKQILATQPKVDANNQAMAMNRGLMNFMPIMQAMFCLTFPIGVGIYWIAGSLFSVIQQYFFNKSLEKVDVEELIKKNQEKAAKLRAKRGEAPEASKFNKFANTPTKSISTVVEDTSDKNSNNKESNDKTKGITIKTKNNYKITDYKKKDGDYKASNIADVANMLKRD